MSLIPWAKIAEVYTSLITNENTKLKIYERTLTKNNTTGETTESLSLLKENISCIFLNNSSASSGNVNIASRMPNNIAIKGAYSAYILFLNDLDIKEYKHIVEVDNQKYSVIFVNDFAKQHFGLQLGLEVLKSGV